MNLEKNRFTVIPKASIRPDKVVFYQQFIRNVYEDSTESVKIPQEVKRVCRDMGVPVRSQPLSNKHNFEISKKASQRIKEKVTWLYTLAKNNTVIPQAGKPLYSFKMNFITLSLPAAQFHQTSQITSECLNQFLIECKSKYGLYNYVWRLEFQKNGNAHYHIATDCFIDWWQAKIVWNRCLEKLGYISAYAKKFSGMTFHSYCANHGDNGKTPFNVLKARFSHGCATRWQTPNTVDVRAVTNSKNISFYISKYITKKSDVSLNPIVSAREDMVTNLRLWYCSRSLSRLDKIEIFMEECGTLADRCLSQLQDVKRYIFDYCSVWYFNLKEQVNNTKKDLWLLYNDYARGRGYVAWKPFNN